MKILVAHILCCVTVKNDDSIKDMRELDDFLREQEEKDVRQHAG